MLSKKSRHLVKEILFYLGVIIMLTGVGLLAFYHFGNHPSNAILAAAGILIIAGFFVQFFHYKRNQK
jgi:cytochrome c biogenesis protein CcdA